MISQQVSTEVSGRYRPRSRNATNESSEALELERLLAAYFSATLAIAQWRQQYDPNDSIFPEAFRNANEQYSNEHGLITQAKEEEPSPIRFMTIQDKTCSTADASKNCEDLITQKQMEPMVVTQDTVHSVEDDNADPLSGSLLSQLEQMRDQTVHDAQNEKKQAAKLAEIVSKKN